MRASGLCKHTKSAPPDVVIGKLLPGHKMSYKDTKVKPEGCCCMKSKDVTFICLLKSNFTGRCLCFVLNVRSKLLHELQC